MHSEPTAAHFDEDLSALADGEVDAGVAARLSAVWRDDAAVRSRWHAYHLIGDVLRSDDLAGHRRDAALWEAVRARMAQEPVVLAPAAASARDSSGARGVRRRWVASAAVAAGFMVVAGALVVLSGPGTQEAAAPQLARAPEPAAPVAQLAAASTAAASVVNDERAAAADRAVIHDARLDRYLAAHQQFGGSSALGVPSGFLRSATYEAPNR